MTEIFRYISMPEKDDTAVSLRLAAQVLRAVPLLAMPEKDAHILVWDEGGASCAKFPEERELFWVSERVLPLPEIFDAVKGRSFLMLDAEVLRGSGAEVSRGISWERTVQELLREFRENPALRVLHGTAYLFVVFGEEGAVLFRGDSSSADARLMLYSGAPEGELRTRYPGFDAETWGVKAACAAVEWARAKAVSSDELADTFCADNVLAPAVMFVECGCAPEVLEGGYEMLTDRPSCRVSCVYPIPESCVSGGEDWRVTAGIRNVKLYDIAFEYAKEGGAAMKAIPHLSIGKWMSVDRKEIEAFQKIRKSIQEYVDWMPDAGSRREETPLVLAFHGAPGSEVLFGMDQLVETLLPESRQVRLSWAAEDRVEREVAVLAEVRRNFSGKEIPVLLLEDFDAYSERKYQEWESLLAAIAREYCGKYIVVLAASARGTWDTASKFARMVCGHADILGSNRSDSTEFNYLLRRAILIRRFLEECPSEFGKVQADDDFLRALLLIPEYRNGDQSLMELMKIYEETKDSWGNPPDSVMAQIAECVNAEAFLRLLRKNEILKGLGEVLARTIHEDYRKTQRARGIPMSEQVDVEWESLPEEYREANREQVGDIAQKLRAVGCGFDAGDTPFPSVKEFEPDEILVLAEQEHIRWMCVKARQGWKYGRNRDESLKISDLMIPYEALPFEEQQKDIDVVENVIPLLERVGLRVYRMV